jgi:hypothetical protein
MSGSRFFEDERSVSNGVEERRSCDSRASAGAGAEVAAVRLSAHDPPAALGGGPREFQANASSLEAGGTACAS